MAWDKNLSGVELWSGVEKNIDKNEHAFGIVIPVIIKYHT
jgi:hypothetical protein